MTPTSIFRIASACTGIALTLSLGACQTPSSESHDSMTHKAIDTSTNRQAKVGDTISIQVRSNPTTGYTWNLAEPVDNEHLQLLGSTYQVDSHKPGMTGVGGTETWNFKAMKAGNANIQLNLARSWEKGIKPAQTALYHIEIK